MPLPKPAFLKATTKHLKPAFIKATTTARVYCPGRQKNGTRVSPLNTHTETHTGHSGSLFHIHLCLANIII